MPAPVLDPVQLLVMANRVDGITREMTNTLVRTCRSTTQLARDFSTSVCTAQAELLTAPEGIPCHVYGSGLLCEALADLHPDFQEGDAFLHNDPYLGSRPCDNHGRGEYRRGTTSTNAIESFWALVKRCYIETHHWWSRKHTQRYLDACVFRLNVRAYALAPRTETLLMAGMTSAAALPYQTLVH